MPWITVSEEIALKKNWKEKTKGTMKPSDTITY